MEPRTPDDPDRRRGGGVQFVVAVLLFLAAVGTVVQIGSATTRNAEVTELILSVFLLGGAITALVRGVRGR